jgi:hypothetical protein
VTKTQKFPRFIKHWPQIQSEVKGFTTKPQAFETDTMPTTGAESLKITKITVWYATLLYIQLHRLQKGKLRGQLRLHTELHVCSKALIHYFWMYTCQAICPLLRPTTTR